MNCGAAHVFLPGLDWRPINLADMAGLDPEERRDLEETRAALAEARRRGIVGDLHKRGGQA